MSTMDSVFSRENVPSIIILLAGLVLFIAPWVPALAMTGAAAWNAWIVGAAVALIAAVALYESATWEGWAFVVLGVWAIVAPWLIGFSAATAALYAHIVLGLIVAVAAAYMLWARNGQTASHV